MKKLFFLVVFAAITTLALAVPAKRGIWKTVKLADGTEVKVELRGDEYMNFWQAENGKRYVKATDKPYFIPADMEKLQAQAMEKRMQSPLPYSSAVVGEAVEGSNKKRVSIGGNHPSFVGSKKGLIILAEFTDMKFQEGHDAEYYLHVANDEGFTSEDGYFGSIHDYFYDQSEGQFDLTFDVVGPVALEHDVAYYGAHSNGSNDKAASTMIREAVKAAANILESFADYDWFDDGYVDQVFVIYAGRGEANGGGDDTIWPHRSEFYNAINLGGKKVKVYACSNEMQSDTQVDGIGAFCHEFSHCLGLADLYDVLYGQYNDDVENYGMGAWDIMDGGCYLGDSFVPCSYSGYERNYCGWKEPCYLTEDTQVDNLKGIAEGGDYYIIPNDACKDEYYILECRSLSGWDSALYGSGLMITHIDFDKTIWAYNYVNSYYPGFNDHQRYTLFLADNEEKVVYVSDIAGDLYPYRRNNLLSNYSVPASTLYHENTDGEKLMSKPITNITQNEDGTVSFTFANEVGKEEEPLPEGCVFRETFNKCYGTGGNDNLWSGTGLAKDTFIADNEGWTGLNKYAGDRCARFGTNTQRGSATTPTVEVEGDMEVVFLAAPWTGEASTLTVTVSVGSTTVDSGTFTLETGTWTEFSQQFNSEEPVTIQFRSNKGRFFLDEVFVNKATANGIFEVEAAEADSQTFYNLAGQRVGENAKGLLIKGGKKVLVK